MNPYRQPECSPIGTKDIEVMTVFGEPKSYVRLQIKTDVSGSYVMIQLPTQNADELARALLVASCAAKAMDMK